MLPDEPLQKAYEESVKFARDVTGGFISDLRSALRQGESFWQAFGNAALNALDKITDRLLNQVLDDVFQVNTAASGIGRAGGGGFLGSVFGGIGRLLGFSHGGYTGNGPRTAVAGVVHGQEFVMNAAATARYRPQLEAMNSGRAANGNANNPGAANQNVTYAPVYNFHGTQAELDEFRRASAQDRAAFDRKVIGVIRNSKYQRHLRS